MTNLLIGYPDIPSRAITWKTYTNSTSENPNELDFNPAYNVFKGARWQSWGSGYKKTEHSLVVDLGTSGTRTASFLYIANAKKQRATAGLNFTIGLERSSDDSTYTSISSEAIDSATLIGVRAEDYFKTFTETSAYRYFRVKFSNASTFLNYASKIYFGNLFDMGTDSFTYTTRLIPSLESEFKSSTGSLYQVKVGDPKYEINITWNDVTDAKLKSFRDDIVKFRHDTPVFLYTTDSHAVLDAKKLIFGYITSVTESNPDQILDRNTLSITLVEDIS